MANYHVRLVARRSADDVFAYMANYAHAVEWNPLATQAAAGDEPGTFELELELAGRVSAFTFATVESSPPERVVLEAISKNFYVRDTIVIAAVDEQRAALSFESSIRFRGFAAIFNALLFVPYRRTGRHTRVRLAAVFGSGDHDHERGHDH